MWVKKPWLVSEMLCLEDVQGVDSFVAEVAQALAVEAMLDF